MRMRRTLVAAVAVAVAIVGSATGAAAAEVQPQTKRTSVSVHALHKDPKPAKPKKFEGRGKISAIDVEAGTLTVVVKGGTKNIRHRTVTVSVSPTARIKRNGKKVSLASLAVGDRIKLRGAKKDDTYTVSRIQAQGPRKPKPAPSPTEND
ncbi:hypothetical protein EV385_1273 [Krasilnikovia cinnamomea]|uniref:DUF5666 domain-containing protein n=1 Tax=Krasilnikovia cinnamomea TaxID=349313 RepID=A0A4Q7ZFH7_9ACTN|nr:hypothetical protein [Krasilnikovia cinnamomea]RZU49520.1 hypothetical protein EV385_1273 [Krasilnikovia cinnamomea]